MPASLNFTVSSQKVVAAANTPINNINTGTVMAWVTQTANTGVQIISVKGTAGGGTRHFFWFNVGQPEFGIEAATFNCDVQSGDTALTINHWWFVAATFSHLAATNLQRLYVGDLLALAKEPGTYANQASGTGAAGSDSADPLCIGQNNGNGFAWGGQIAFVAYWNNQLLTPGQIRRMQLISRLPPPLMRIAMTPDLKSNLVAMWQLGWTGTSPQPDLSGRNNTGTVTGAALAAGVPSNLNW